LRSYVIIAVSLAVLPVLSHLARLVRANAMKI
jgi:hypothetical protein